VGRRSYAQDFLIPKQLRGLVEYHQALSLLVRNMRTDYERPLKELLSQAIQAMEWELRRRGKAEYDPLIVEGQREYLSTM